MKGPERPARRTRGSDSISAPHVLPGPPAWSLFGLLAGEELAGVAGVFLSVPVLAATKIAATRIGEEWHRTHAASAAMPAAADTVVAPTSAPAATGEAALFAPAAPLP